MDELDQIKALAGVYSSPPKNPSLGASFGLSSQEKAKIMREKNIRPGDKEWFQLWFSLPYLTGEKPVGDKDA